MELTSITQRPCPYKRFAPCAANSANTLSIFRMILSANWTAVVIIASVRGLPYEPPNKSSAVLKCRATRILTTIASTRLRPSSMRVSDFVFRSSSLRRMISVP